MREYFIILQLSAFYDKNNRAGKSSQGEALIPFNLTDIKCPHDIDIYFLIAFVPKMKTN